MPLNVAYCMGKTKDGHACSRKVPKVGRLVVYRYCWQHRNQG